MVKFICFSVIKLLTNRIARARLPLPVLSPFPPETRRVDDTNSAHIRELYNSSTFRATHQVCRVHRYTVLRRPHPTPPERVHVRKTCASRMKEAGRGGGWGCHGGLVRRLLCPRVLGLWETTILLRFFQLVTSTSRASNRPNFVAICAPLPTPHIMPPPTAIYSRFNSAHVSDTLDICPLLRGVACPCT